MPAETNWKQKLSSILEEFKCQTGTIHQTRPDGSTLKLISCVGIPEFLLDKISLIPFGKGIAGAAAETKEPVELCNLQNDLGGVAKPDAQKTNAAGSLAVPIFDPKNQQVIGTLGIGMTTPHDFSDDEKQRLARHAEQIATIFKDSPPCVD